MRFVLLLFVAISVRKMFGKAVVLDVKSFSVYVIFSTSYMFCKVYIRKMFVKFVVLIVK